MSQCPVCKGLQAGRLQQCSECKSYFHFPQCGIIPVVRKPVDVDGEAWRDRDDLGQRSWKAVELRDSALCGVCSGWDHSLIRERRSEKFDPSMTGITKKRKLTSGEVLARQYAALRNSSPKKQTPYTNRANEPLKPKKKVKNSDRKKPLVQVDQPLTQVNDRISEREVPWIAHQTTMKLKQEESNLKRLESQKLAFQRASNLAKRGQSGEPVVLPRFTLVWLNQELEKLIQRAEQEILESSSLISRYRTELENLENTSPDHNRVIEKI